MAGIAKDCSVCVYGEQRSEGQWVCISDRHRYPSITDCTILEKPLRAIQEKCKDVETFKNVTEEYVRVHKNQSDFWKRIENSSWT